MKISTRILRSEWSPLWAFGYFGELRGFCRHISSKGWNVPLEQSAATWRRAVEMNLTVPFSLTQQLAPLLKESGRGSVVNFSSIYGLMGPDLRLYEGTSMNNPAAYGAAKGDCSRLTRWLSTVLAPDIRVNAITPGGVCREGSLKFFKSAIQAAQSCRAAWR